MSSPHSFTIVGRSARVCAVALVAMLLVVVSALPGDAISGRAVTVEGRLEAVHVDDFEGNHTLNDYRVRAADGTVTFLTFDDRGPEELIGKVIRATGERLGNRTVHVGRSQYVYEQGGGNGAGTPSPTTSGNPGHRRVAVILFNFRDKALQPLTAMDAKSLVFAPTQSVNEYFLETSFGDTGLRGVVDPAGDVYGWYTINASYNDACNAGAWASAARVAAAADGFLDSNYDNVVHAMPKATNCEWAGMAEFGGKYSWVARDTVPLDLGNHVRAWRGTVAHELGHNFSLSHAGTWTCTANGVTVAISSSCTLLDYGDPFSSLGMGKYERQYNSFQKGRLGWYDAANVKTVTMNTTVTLSQSETSSPAVQSVRVPRTKNRKGVVSDYYYVELRRPVGYDAAYPNFPEPNGVMIRVAPDHATNAVTKLIDTTPQTPGDFGDAELLVGKSFKDATAGVTISVTGEGLDTATVAITFP